MGSRTTVRQCARDGGAHGEFGTPVGADDRIHGLAEHVEGDAQRDPEEILPRAGEGLLVDPPAEQGEEHVHAQQVDRRQNGAAPKAEQDGAADAPVGVLIPTGAQGDADEGAAAVADHHGDGQGDHRQGEHHRVGGVAVGAEIVGVCDKDLIDDVVERGDDKGENTGDGVLPHQRPDPLCFQKCV